MFQTQCKLIAQICSYQCKNFGKMEIGRRFSTLGNRTGSLFLLKPNPKPRERILPSRNMLTRKFNGLQADANATRRRPTENVTSGSSGSKGSGAFLLIIPVATFGLGVWQVYRWKWKLGLIQEMENKVGAKPVDFPLNNLDSLNDLEYSKVRLHGKFDYSKEALIGPRSLISSKNEREGRGLISHGSGSSNGYHVITPFEVAGAAGDNLRILVNRGWIPNRTNLENYRGNNNKNEEVEITGVVRKHEDRQPFMQKYSNFNSINNLWLSRDLHSLSSHLGTSEIFLDLVKIEGVNAADENGAASSLPIPGQTRVTLRNEHVSYFLTWFSLSAITGYMWHRMIILKRPLR